MPARPGGRAYAGLLQKCAYDAISPRQVTPLGCVRSVRMTSIGQAIPASRATH